LGEQGSESHDVVTRRSVLTGAGVAVAGGLAAGAVVGTGTASATAPVAAGGIAVGAPGATVAELVCRIVQAGLDFNAFGYLTGVAGIPATALFGDPALRDEAHALFVVTGTGALVGRSVDLPVHALDIEGELIVRQLADVGASWDDPATFAGGVLLARYTLVLQDVLTVIAPQTGLPVLNGTATQDEAGDFGGQAFGSEGQVLRFTATGFGTRQDTDPDLANAQAQLSIAGSMFAV
jgi:hypothetical protein